jgi:hypothetical protein
LFALLQKLFHVDSTTFYNYFKSSGGSLLIHYFSEREEALGDLNNALINFTDSEFFDLGIVFKNLSCYHKIATSNNHNMLLDFTMLYYISNHSFGVVVFLESLACDLDGTVNY